MHSRRSVGTRKGIKITKQKKSGKQQGEAGKAYEQAVQEKTGGKSKIIDGREIDSVTHDALIQVKDSESAVNNPHNFLNKKTRAQIKETVNMAKQQHKRAEFWFKKAPHWQVKQYIEDKGGKVVIWGSME